MFTGGDTKDHSGRPGAGNRRHEYFGRNIEEHLAYPGLFHRDVPNSLFLHQ